VLECKKIHCGSNKLYNNDVILFLFRGTYRQNIAVFRLGIAESFTEPSAWDGTEYNSILFDDMATVTDIHRGTN